jgi:hypothetical protein
VLLPYLKFLDLTSSTALTTSSTCSALSRENLQGQPLVRYIAFLFLSKALDQRAFARLWIKSVDLVSVFFLEIQ